MSTSERAEQVKRIVDNACAQARQITKPQRRRTALRQIEGRLKRPLAEYMAYGTLASLREARGIVSKIIRQTMTKKERRSR